MKYGKELRFMGVIAGAERSGKTYFAEHFAEEYSRSGGVIVYNPGRDDDFEEYKTLEFLPLLQSVYKLNVTDKDKKRRILSSPVFLHFRINGKLYPTTLLTKAMFEYRKVKVYRIGSLKDEGRFFKTVHDFLTGCLLINDDFRGVARNIAKPELAPLIELFSRKNHAGKKSKHKTNRVGVDILNIFHHIDKVNSEIYDYTTHVFLFNLTRKIKGYTLDNDDALDALHEAYSELQKAPRYSYGRVALKGEDAFLLKIIKPK